MRSLLPIFLLALSNYSASQEAVDFDSSGKGTVKIGESCKRDWQCIENAFCRVQMTCLCDPPYAPGPDMSKCHATSGTNCLTNVDCATMANADCIQGSCTCQNNFILDINNSSNCIVRPTKPGDSCQRSDECADTMYRSLCINGKCQCIGDFRFTNETGRCIETRGIYQPCNHSYECYDPSKPNALYCKNGECAYTQKHLANGSEVSTAGALGLLVLHFFFFFFLLA